MDMNNGVGSEFHYLHKMQSLFIFTLLKTRAEARARLSSWARNK